MLGFKEYIREVDLSFFRDHPKLGDLEGKLKTKLSFDESQALARYNSHSHVLNKSFINYHNNGIEPPNNVPTELGTFNLRALDAATNKRFNRSFTMYSGLGFDPRNQLKNNKLFLPAFTSGSLSKRTAGRFMKYTDENGFQHILRVNVKHNDHGVSMFPIDTSEHEIVLPRKAILHIHRSEIDPENPNVIVHHATIDHESDPHDFKNPTNNHLINDLMHKIQSNTHTNEDLYQAVKQGYLSQEHLDELFVNNNLLNKIHTKTHTMDDLYAAKEFGYLTNKIKDAHIKHMKTFPLIYDLKFAKEHDYLPEELKDKQSEALINTINHGVHAIYDLETAKICDYLTNEVKKAHINYMRKTLLYHDLMFAKKYLYLPQKLEDKFPEALTNSIKQGKYDAHDLYKALSHARKHDHITDHHRKLLADQLTQLIKQRKHTWADIENAKDYNYFLPIHQQLLEQ